MELRLGWSRALAVLAIAVAVALALVAFQYFVVLRVSVGFVPDQPFPVTASQRVDCFRALFFLGPRQGCPEGFTSRSSLEGAAAVNFLACVAAASIPVLAAGGPRWRENTEDKTIGFSASVLTALPLVSWALVSSFGLLIGSALAD